MIAREISIHDKGTGLHQCMHTLNLSKI